MRPEGQYTYAWKNVDFQGRILVAETTGAIRQVGMIRFRREDGLDPRIDPEPGGTHLSRGAPGDRSGRLEASCGIVGRGYADYGPLDGITCPDCAAMLAAQLIKGSGYD